MSDGKYIRGKVSCNGNETEYIKFGCGRENLVIIPGVAMKSVLESAGMLAAAFTMFADDFTVYVFDRKLDMPQGYRESEMADDLVNALFFLGVEHAYIYGASQGGIIAQLIAEKYPDFPKKMFLVSTMARISDRTKYVIQRWIDAARTGDTEKAWMEMAGDIFGKKTLDMLGDSVKMLVRDVSEKDAERFIIQAEAVLSEETAEGLEKIKCPVMVAGSENDRVVPADEIRFLAEKIGCPCFMTEDFGHAVYDEYPALKRKMYDFFMK